MTAAVMISETVDLIFHLPKSTGKLIVDEGGKEDRKDQRKKKAAGMCKDKLIEKVRISPLTI
jgi:hypothetical protein